MPAARSACAVPVPRDFSRRSARGRLHLFSACLLGSSDAGIDDELTQKEVRQAFAAAQTESAFGAEEQTLVETANLSHLQLMSYPEFIEGIARLGAMKWEEKSIALFEKVELAVNAIVGIV